MKYFLVLVLTALSFKAKAQSIYFPPVNNNLPWDTISPQSLGWCTNKIDSLYDYLSVEKSKAFIVLKDGKIVLEKYFGTFTKDSVWYWASAGKTITSFLVGKANEDGILKLSDSTSKFLGTGWTNAPPNKEGKITIRNQITMTSGLDDGVPDDNCTIDTCLNYLADAGNRWAYHNGPYTLLEKVLENASGQNINIYTQQKLKTQTGITGSWLTIDYDNVYISKPRAMARFGILIQNKCKWNNTVLLSDTAYIRQMVNTSQPLNKSYGYLWWLNGKSSFMAPTSQIVFPGSYAPDAPADMYGAIGKNGQILSIAPSSGIIFVRMGDANNSNSVPFTFCSQIWKRLNAVICQTTASNPILERNEALEIFPNPTKDQLNLRFPKGTTEIQITDILNREILNEKISFEESEKVLETRNWKTGCYLVRCLNNKGWMVKKVWKD
jgi:CubicO group peptidase (beta-lactamase class C family)